MLLMFDILLKLKWCDIGKGKIKKGTGPYGMYEYEKTFWIVNRERLY
jgi:hypothetical protein